VRRAPLALLSGAVAALAAAAGAAAQPPQQVVLPGPVPYPTTIPPLLGTTALPQIYLTPRLHVASDQHVLVGIDGDGRAASIRVRQRLVVIGKGDYQLAVSAPIVDVRAAPGSQSEPGLRTDQVLWAGFSPARKTLAADVFLRRPLVVRYLPLRLRVERAGDRVVLTVANATPTPESLYTGNARRPELARLLDETRRASLAGVRLTGTFATFDGTPRLRKKPVAIEAPLHVEGELRLPGTAPVVFDRTLGDGQPLSFQVEARGAGIPQVHLLARPAPVVRLLRPPGAGSWAAAIRRRALPAADLLERLMVTRMRLVRADQYQSFLADPDADGRSRTVYEFRTVAARSHRPAVVPADSGGGGSNALLVALVAVGSVVLAAGGLVAWAHS
jgi:hypothetical protein